ncbi:MAG TPA: RsmE family RNA methyltransferase [Tissierellaceae bacterium]
MRKFFVDKENIINDSIFIYGQDRKHIVDVLRLSLEDEIIASCEEINYFTKISNIDDEKVTLKIYEKSSGNNEPKINITLFQGLAKGDKMDFITQKGTEIGIKSFYGVQMERSVVKAKDRKWIDSKLKRYNKISEEASKQCKRDYIPEFKDIISFNEMVKILKEKENILIPFESEGDNKIKDVLKKVNGKDINIIIGPEGGFSSEEINKLKEIGGLTLSLSNRIFRTETAGLVASTITLYELEDMGVI